MVSVHTEVEKLGGKFVLGRDVINRDLHKLSLRWGNIQVGETAGR